MRLENRQKNVVFDIITDNIDWHYSLHKSMIFGDIGITYSGIIDTYRAYNRSWGGEGRIVLLFGIICRRWHLHHHLRLTCCTRSAGSCGAPSRRPGTTRGGTAWRRIHTKRERGVFSYIKAK